MASTAAICASSLPGFATFRSSLPLLTGAEGGVGAVDRDGADAEEVGALVPSDEVATSAPARTAHEVSVSEASRAATVAAPRTRRFSACIPCLRNMSRVSSG